MHPIIVSQVTGKLDITSLDEIKDEAVHRVRISVSHVSAPTLKIKEKGELKPCPAKTTLKKGQEKVICLQMLVKDAGQLSSNLFTRVSVVDCGKFLGINPDDFNEKKVREQLVYLERFNVWLDATVQRKNGQLVVTEATSLKKM